MASDDDGAEGPVRVQDLLVDFATHRVLRGNKPLKVGGLTLKFLRVLVERAPDPVSYDEIAERVWGGRPVTPETMAQRAKLLRAALADDAQHPRYVELVRGYGYRLIPVPSVDDPASGLLRRQRRVWVFAALSAVSTLLIIGAVLVMLQQRPPSVAVLPFTDLSAEGDQTYFGDGMAEQLIDELTRLDGVRVASRTSSFGYRDPQADTRLIGDALNVTTILEGSVRRSGETLRITAQLIDAEAGFHLWSDSFDRPMEDLLSVQDEIAGAVAGVLGVSLGIRDANAFRGAGTSSIQAYEAYLRALRQPQMEDRVRLLERALQFDPDYGAVLATLGLTTASSMWSHAVEEAPRLLEKTKPLIMRAVELDPNSAYAVALMAVTSYPSREWEASEALFRRAEQIQPTGEILFHHANMLMRTGRSTAALALYGTASRADRLPVSRSGYFELMALLALGRFAEIERLIEDKRLGSDINPDGIRYFLALNRGDASELKAAFDRLSSTGHEALTTHLAELRERFDSPALALSILHQLFKDTAQRWPSKYHDIALHAAFFGDAAFALEVFAVEVRLTAIRYGSLWFPVMADARRQADFTELMKDVELASYWQAYGWADHCEPVSDGGFHCF